MITLVNGIDRHLRGQGISARPRTASQRAASVSGPQNVLRTLGYHSESMATNETARVCAVCDEPVEPHTDSLCGSCGKTFHLNQRADMPGKDCGDVWINGEHLGLEFTCQTCLESAAQAASTSTALNEILDLPESAALLGMAESELLAKAKNGEIQHRKTAGGLLLFERGALLAMQGSAPQ